MLGPVIWWRVPEGEEKPSKMSLAAVGGVTGE